MYYFYRIINQIIRIAKLAGDEIMTVYNKNPVFLNEIKERDHSPVTDADLNSNQIIQYELNNLTPDIPIISEECIPEWKECSKWDCFWLIDPLDGTKEFLSKNGEFTVNIAFVRYGEPIIGLIYMPVYNILYVSHNSQSWKINSQGRWVKINTQFSKNPIVVMSRSHVTRDQQNLYNDYVMNIKNCTVINVGSSFKFCLVAEGVAQFYPRFSVTKIWDTAAGHAIVKSAGGVVNDWSGSPLNYRNFNEYFTNPEFQVSLC